MDPAMPNGIAITTDPIRACMQALMPLGRSHITASSGPHPNPPPRQRI